MGIVGWFIRLERRLAAYLPRADHDEICEKRSREIKEEIGGLREDIDRRHVENRDAFGEIKQLMREERQVADKHREGVRDSLEVIRTKVAVLQDRQAEGLFDDAGRVRSGRGG